MICCIDRTRFEDPAAALARRVTGRFGVGRSWLNPWAALESQPDVMPPFGGDSDFSCLLIPNDKPQLSQDRGNRVPLMPFGQGLDAALGQKPAIVGMAKICVFERGLHLLVCNQIGDGFHARVSAIALMRHEWSLPGHARAIERGGMEIPQEEWQIRL